MFILMPRVREDDPLADAVRNIYRRSFDSELPLSSFSPLPTQDPAIPTQTPTQQSDPVSDALRSMDINPPTHDTYTSSSTNPEPESSSGLKTFIQLAAPVGLAATNPALNLTAAAFKAIQLGNMGPYLSVVNRLTTGNNALRSTLMKAFYSNYIPAFQRINNLPLLSRIPGFNSAVNFITNTTLTGSVKGAELLGRATGAVSKLTSGISGATGTAATAATAAKAATTVGKVGGFIGGRALPILGAFLAGVDCIIDIGKACEDPSGVNIANAAVNIGCTGVGAVIGGIIGTAIPIPGVGTAIGACIGAGIGNLVGNIFKSAITPGGMINNILKATGITKAVGYIGKLFGF